MLSTENYGVSRVVIRTKPQQVSMFHWTQSRSNEHRRGPKEAALTSQHLALSRSHKHGNHSETPGSCNVWYEGIMGIACCQLCYELNCVQEPRWGCPEWSKGSDSALSCRRNWSGNQILLAQLKNSEAAKEGQGPQVPQLRSGTAK